MTSEQLRRKQEFDKLFAAIPGTNQEKIKAVCKAIYCQPNTVEIWCMRNPPRVISERNLKFLRMRLENTGETTV